MTLEEVKDRLKLCTLPKLYGNDNCLANVEDIKFLLNYIENESIPKEKVRKKIEKCDSRRKELANGEFWSNYLNVKEDTALAIVQTALEELLGE